MEKYWEWFCSIPGLYHAQQETLLRCFGTPEAVWNAGERELAHLKERGCTWTAKIQKFRKEISPEKAVHMHRREGIQFISREHAGYPERLGPLDNRPYGLFYRGELPEETARSVAIVGARVCTRSGKEMARQLAVKVAQAGGAVISGAAYGIDGTAQWAALEAGGRSFAVLGCGVDVCYPAPHRELLDRLSRQGGILSEFPPGTPPKPFHFPVRNRIISGLADIVVVVEARAGSGSLITADFAAEQGRSVMAVPGRPQDELSEGCNTLISQGAGVILSADSFIKTAFPEYQEKKMQLSGDMALAPAEKLVYSSLDFYAKTIWELEELTALSLADLSGSLLSLEARGLIRETGHGCYVRRA